MPQQRAGSRSGRTAGASLPTGTVTFLFTDIEGSTRLLQEASRAYGDLLSEHRRLLRAAFTAHGGREVDTQGDSFFVAFRGPAQAVAAAVDAQRALAAHEWPPEAPVRVRMGLHTGEAVVVEGSYVSIAVHRAARIAAAAHGGQVLLSEATASLVRDELSGGVGLRDLGEHRLKDFPAPSRLFQLVVTGLPADFPPPLSLGRRRQVLSPPGSFVGRESDVAAVVGRLRDHRTRLLTLTGPGGIGKTRLAVEAAHLVAADLPGGAVFVTLAAVTDPALVVGAIADALGARREPGDDAIAVIAAALGDDRTLVVLDNLEQVAGAAGDLADLVERVPSVVLLVTSRSLLKLRVEEQFRVRPLDEAAAVRLFADRAAAVRPVSGSAADELAMAEIARRLDGLPLAIELAAARARLLPPQVLLKRLRGRLDVLGYGPVDLPERQRTLRATMNWSHDLLRPHEQALFARLAVFVGGWELDALERVCARSDEPDVLDTLGALVDASLVVVDEAGPEPRFSMLETVRGDAMERLVRSPDKDQTETAHTQWMLALTDELLHSRGDDYRCALHRMDRERANYRAAVQRVLAARDLAAAARLIRDALAYLAFRDAEPEVAAWLDQALAASGEAPPPVVGRLLVLRAAAAMALGDLPAISPLLRRGRPLIPDGHEYDVDRALVAVAEIEDGFERGLDEAARAVHVALDRFTALGMELGQASMHLAAADMALARRDHGTAAHHYHAAADLAETVGEEAMLGRALSMLGLTQLDLGDHAAARRSIVAGALANQRAGQQTSMAYSLEGLASLALAERRPAVAARSLAAAAAARGRNARLLTPALPPLIEQIVTRCRELLGQDAFELAWTEGERSTLHQALEQTLQELSEPAAPHPTG
ncbi:ATP-binding protein [Geodermatophilus sp. SYSU D00691]